MSLEFVGFVVMAIFFVWLGVRRDDRREVATLVDRMNTRFGDRWLAEVKVSAASPTEFNRAQIGQAFVAQMADIASVLGPDVRRLVREAHFWGALQASDEDFPLSSIGVPEISRALEGQGQRIVRCLDRLERRANRAGVQYPPSFAYYLRSITHRGGLPLSADEATLTFEGYVAGWREEISRTCSYYRGQVDSTERSVAG